jgi:imidazole glycerol-phosphate synthase subunit HisH
MTAEMKISVVDYQMSNLFSVKNIFEHLGIKINVVSSAQEINAANALILPGIGAFGEAIANLERLQLITPIKNFITSGKPFMGICLGLQLLFSKSYEFGVHEGLGIIEGEVIKLPQEYQGRAMRVPTIGWNKISAYNDWVNTPLHNLKNNEFVYFVHSYYVKPNKDEWVLSTTQYNGLTYCSSLHKDNVFATQFHPEKSGGVGLEILRNWIASIK